MGAGEEVRAVPRALAFGDFYPNAHDEVFRALTLTLRDPELAADATQEALARAYARWEDVAGYDNPTGWVYRVGLNWARSRFRKRAREVLKGRFADRRGIEMPEPADPAVALALQGLPVGQRAVVVLRLYCDWSVEDVASALDVSEGTVKSRLSRALERLRDRLEEPR